MIKFSPITKFQTGQVPLLVILIVGILIVLVIVFNNQAHNQSAPASTISDLEEDDEGFDLDGDGLDDDEQHEATAPAGLRN